MKKNFIKKFSFLILTILLILPICYATQFKSGRKILVKKDEVLNEDFFAIGETIIIEGKVNGDLFFLCKDITINGEVKGDIIGLANMITFNGNSLDDLRVGAQLLNINGSISKNVSIAGQYITVSNHAKIGGDLIFGCNLIKIEGEVLGEVRGGGDIINVHGKIWKSAIFNARELIIYPSASFKEDLKYRAEKAEIMEGAEFLGKVEKLLLKKKIRKSRWVNWKFYFWKLLFMLAGIIFGYLFMKIFPFYLSKVREQVSHLWKSLGIGFALLVSVPVLVIILAITIIGLPISLALLAIYLIFLYTGKVLLALFVGERILKKESSLLSISAGVLIFTILFNIPYAGWVLNLIAISIGLGALGMGSVLFFREER
ncbi:MAG: hypothetical protein ACUVUG_09500 [Candidatus Aminicenantia bacterium]